MAGESLKIEIARSSPPPGHSAKKISPKIVIISHFEPEEITWHNREGFELKPHSISVPGLSGQHPRLFSTDNEEVFQVTTSMGLINAALTISALLASSSFDLTKTYFLIAGVAGINPTTSTLGSVTLARYVTQVDLQYELDAREIPQGWTAGYFPFGSASPSSPPEIIYGTEVFELNATLRDKLLAFASSAPLQQSVSVTEHCNAYNLSSASSTPSILTADVTASNVFFHGKHLSKSVENACELFTDGKAVYGLTAQEDSATLATLLRGHLQNKVDFSRVICMRAASNFDQPPSGHPISIPLHTGHGGFELSLENLYLVGRSITDGILASWEDTFKDGVKAENYIGDVFGSLGGTPDFGGNRFVRIKEGGKAEGSGA